jgi:hypothetical protein
VVSSGENKNVYDVSEGLQIEANLCGPSDKAVVSQRQVLYASTHNFEWDIATIN